MKKIIKCPADCEAKLKKINNHSYRCENGYEYCIMTLQEFKLKIEKLKEELNTHNFHGAEKLVDEIFGEI